MKNQQLLEQIDKAASANGMQQITGMTLNYLLKLMIAYFEERNMFQIVQSKPVDNAKLNAENLYILRTGSDIAMYMNGENTVVEIYNSAGQSEIISMVNRIKEAISYSQQLQITAPLDGKNDTFTTDCSFAAGSTQVWLNGTLLACGSDYVETGENEIQFLKYAPASSDSLIILAKTIAPGIKGDKGEKGDTGEQGEPYEIAKHYLTPESDLVFFGDNEKDSRFYINLLNDITINLDLSEESRDFEMILINQDEKTPITVSLSNQYPIIPPISNITVDAGESITYKCAFNSDTNEIYLTK